LHVVACDVRHSEPAHQDHAAGGAS
jgi:hypothetical protein